jgi:hypothetical protein
MNIHTVCVAHVLPSVVIHLRTNKLYYVFNHHHQKLASVYKVCPKSHKIYFFAAPLLVAACSNRLSEVRGPLSS